MSNRTFCLRTFNARMLNVLQTKWRLPGALFLGGAFHALSFAPDPLPAWALSAVQLILMAWLVRCIWQAPTAQSAAGRAWMFALGHFMVGLYWLTISMHTYGYIPLPLAILALGCVAAYLALFAALAAWITHITGCAPWSEGLASRTGPLWAALVWAAAWTLCEWLRATLFTGFPWLNTGYAHMDSWFANWAAITGVYGVTFITAFTAAAIAGLVGATHFSARHQPQRAVAGVIAIVLLGIGAGLQHFDWSTSSGHPTIVRLVQGNVDQGMKFAPSQIMANINEHLELAGAPVPPGGRTPQLVLLPETALAIFQHQIDPEVWQAWRNLASSQGSTIIMGAALFDRDTRHYTNSVIGINGETPVASIIAGTTTQRYDKHHLVPFGEFIPWGFRWFTDIMNIPLGDFHRGALVQPPFVINDQHLAVNVCYEDTFGEELLPVLPGETGATILANFSNLGWFGDSFALRQHWQMARMRALETSRPMLRATNTGTTGAIDQHGQPLATLPVHRAGVLDVSVQGQTGLTPYARLGNLPVLLCAILVLAAAAYRRQTRKPA